MFGFIRRYFDRKFPVFHPDVDVTTYGQGGKGGKASVGGTGIAIHGRDGSPQQQSPINHVKWVGLVAVTKTSARTATLQFVKRGTLYDESFALEIVLTWDADLDGLKKFWGIS